MNGKIVCIANRKGGVGKTTATIALAHGLQVQRKSVAVVDVDPQGSATNALAGDGMDAQLEQLYIERWFAQRAPAVPPKAQDGLVYGQISRLTDHPDVPLALLPCSEELWDMEDLMAARMFANPGPRWRTLMNRLKQAYDVIVIDTPPGRSKLGELAVKSADLILVPCDATRISVRAMRIFRRDLKKLRPHAAAFVLWTRYKDNQTVASYSRDLDTELLKVGLEPFPRLQTGDIGENVDGLPASPCFSERIMKEAFGSFASLYSGSAALAVRELTRNVLTRLEA